MNLTKKIEVEIFFDSFSGYTSLLHYSRWIADNQDIEIISVVAAQNTVAVTYRRN